MAMPFFRAAATTPDALAGGGVGTATLLFEFTVFFGKHFYGDGRNGDPDQYGGYQQ